MDSFRIGRTFDRRQYSANVAFEHQGQLYSGTIKDLSLGGAFIITSGVNNFSIGDVIEVEIPLTTGNKQVKRSAVIRRMNSEGFGIEFFWSSPSILRLPASVIHRLGELIRLIPKHPKKHQMNGKWNGRLHFNTSIHQDLIESLRSLANKTGKRQNELVEEALRDLLQKYSDGSK